MATANFEELCRGLCDVAGAEPPDLTPDALGNCAIEVEFNDVRVILVHRPQSGPGRAGMRVIFGPLPAGRELQACRALLDINAQTQNLGTTFGRNPATGEIVLKQEYVFADTTPVDLYGRIVSIVEGVRGWRQHHFIVEDQRVTAGSSAI
jgi:hypothetical protein